MIQGSRTNYSGCQHGYDYGGVAPSLLPMNEPSRLEYIASVAEPISMHL